MVERAGKRWTEASVRAAIAKRHRAGKPMDNASVVGDEAGLAAAASRIYSGWYEALAACGIDPAPWRADRRRYRTAEDVVAEIRSRYDAGSVEERRLLLCRPRTACQALLPRAERFFGTWEKAVAAAGLRREMKALSAFPRKPPSQRWHGTAGWIEERVRWRKEIGASLDASDVQREDRELFMAANRVLGSWARAVALASGRRGRA